MYLFIIIFIRNRPLPRDKYMKTNSIPQQGLDYYYKILDFPISKKDFAIQERITGGDHGISIEHQV